MSITGKRIVFYTFGSLGDVYPFLALSRELKRRGHEPAIATTRLYQEMVEREGIRFHAVRPDLDVNDRTILERAMHPRDGGRYIVCELVLPYLRESYQDTEAAAEGADLVVTHPITFAAFLFARRSGLPWASVAMAPVSLYSVHDAPVMPGFPPRMAAWPPWFHRLFLKTLAGLFEPKWKPFRKLEKELGLSRAPNPLFWGHSPQLALGLFSPLLAPPQPDWPANAHATGFPFFSHDEGNSVELQRFLDSGDPPLVFTLGSAAVGVAGGFYRESVEAARRLGRRAVLLIGRDPRNRPAEKLPERVIAVEYAPHAAVFPQAAVVVHQGGIGTTGEAMRAGRPMLVVPHSHDQPDHAARLVRMGLARSIEPKQYRAARVAQEIGVLLENRAYAARASAAGMRIRNENGVAAACDRLEGMLGDREDPRAADSRLTMQR